nr:nitroreductase [Lachnospiraceae bacterium]
VRNYRPDRIEDSKVEKIRQMIDELNKEGNLHLQFIENAGNTYNKLLNRAMGLGSAPSVIACVGADDETLDQRVGYFGERLVLELQEMGLNTCWTGTFNRKTIQAEVAGGERLVISIAVGYGKDHGKPHKSKSAEQVIVAEGERPYWFNRGVEMALLAPTAVNQQKFQIRLNADNSVDVVDKGGVLSQVDVGIVMRHFEVGSEKSVKKTF